ncbi:GOLPH3/VPS74 family protein [Micromonospora sp. NBC_01813]|uniref:GOLPH3/VPS74 family protein n=1 Tax=Micromonospora sp. NBC_01813 TaxID=2975988 RepID=UPI002DDBB98F|nr:GPP34 family phosphoprotein [Micromonospora sp. NBC_01813]WSA11212.1 GPP34 family phosphoprotein [Micromonospora sp. NBC_01813]
MSTYPLADDLFRVAHHRLHGRPLLHPRALSHGLAAGLLAELLYPQWITIHDGRIVIGSRIVPPDDLVHGILAQISAVPTPQPVRAWVEVLSETAVRQVATRLASAGHVRREVTRRRLVGRGERWVPTDMNTAGWPAARLASALRARRRLDVTDQGLVALTWACGLDRYVLDGAPPHAYDDLRNLVDHGWPPIVELARQTRAGIGRAVAAHRG